MTSGGATRCLYDPPSQRGVTEPSAVAPDQGGTVAEIVLEHSLTIELTSASDAATLGSLTGL